MEKGRFHRNRRVSIGLPLYDAAGFAWAFMDIKAEKASVDLYL
jgi:hypothetical protein